MEVAVIPTQGINIPDMGILVKLVRLAFFVVNYQDSRGDAFGLEDRRQKSGRSLAGNQVDRRFDA